MTSKPRARDLGIPLEGSPGPYNAITDEHPSITHPRRLSVRWQGIADGRNRDGRGRDDLQHIPQQPG